MKLVVGLGNPGKQYVNTRHNIGYTIVNALAETERLQWSVSKKHNAEIAKKNSLLIAKPMTFMNDSGKSVHSIMAYYDLGPEDVLVCHDDADLPFGEMQLAHSKGAAGHNGIKSIIQMIGTKSFARIRFGIRNPQEMVHVKAEDFVLKNFTKAEKDRIPDLLSAALEKIVGWQQT